jgi:predicted lipase
VLGAVTAFLKSYPSAKVLCTGHSLGGALAGLAALDLKRLHLIGSGLSVYTFGQPRFGDKVLGQYVYDLF